LLIVLLGLLLSGCLPALVHDEHTRSVASAPEGVWPIHRSSSRAHWLLRGSPGWIAAEQTGYGLYSAGEAVAVLRVVRFDTPINAAAGFARLTPEYLVRSFPGEIAFVPWADTLHGEVPTAQAEVYSYLIAFAPNVASPFPGRLVKLRHGRFVVLLSGIGLSDVQIGAASAAIAYQAEQVDSPHTSVRSGAVQRADAPAP
jgi:hypothetical protein